MEWKRDNPDIKGMPSFKKEAGKMESDRSNNPMHIDYWGGYGMRALETAGRSPQL